MVVLADDGFVKKDWHPENLKICKPGEWNTRMIVDIVPFRVNRSLHADFGLPLQESDASCLGLLQNPFSFHYGHVQYPRSMAWYSTR
jgi:hypothetical protein